MLLVMMFLTLVWIAPPAASTQAEVSAAVSAASQRAPQEVPRDARGRIKRSTKAKRDFQRGQPCPSTWRSAGPCPGYQIDHTVPLACGGPDTPANMQWLSLEAKRQKDRVERRNC